MLRRKKVGFIVNPIAGLGGRVGLKGSDGADIVEKALALGGKPEAPIRAGYALSVLAEMKERPKVYTYGGSMGENQSKEFGFETIVLGFPNEARTTPQDTINAAKLMREAEVDLIIFAGGDGTARNIYEAIGYSIPVIGIPAGVKIHSAVYATNPRNAGLIAKDYLEGRINQLRESEVMDIDEDLFRQGIVNAKLYGYMNVPESGARVQKMKSGGATEEGDLYGMAGYVVCNMEEDTIYIIGPGSTTRCIMQDLGLPNTLLGVDVVKNKQLIASDVSDMQLWELIKDPREKVKIIVTIIGGQGNLFGRGNQQISPRIIRRVGKENIIVVATSSKLIALKGQPLLVDTGDPDLDQELGGYIEVIIAFNQSTYFEVSN